MTNHLLEITEHVKNGNLQKSLALIKPLIKDSPSNTLLRVFYVELLCHDNQLEKADMQLKMIADMDASLLYMVTHWRALIRSADYRIQSLNLGLAPKLFHEPTDYIKNRLLLLDNIANDKPINNFNNIEFASFVDHDDFFECIVECFDSTGDYYWIDSDLIASINFERPKRMIERLWRFCEIELTNGDALKVYIPSIYPFVDNDDQHKLGLATHYSEHNGLIRAQGLRTWLFDNKELTINEACNQSVMILSQETVEE